MSPPHDRKVVILATQILHTVRGGDLFLLPLRTISPLPHHDVLLRPVDTVRISYLGKGISCNGFRQYEPCCVSDPIYDIGLKRHIVGGNHRHAAARDAGKVFLPSSRVTETHLRHMMKVLKEEDDANIMCGTLMKHFSDLDQAHRCLQILQVTLQGLEPSPKPLSCLQQVQMLRTALLNDRAAHFMEARPAAYGGLDGLRRRIFPSHAGTDDNSIHFLLNNRMSVRHKNKLLSGSRVLMGTRSAFKVPNRPDVSSYLDVLVFWESMGFIPPLLDTHLSYVGPLGIDDLHKFMERARDEIEKCNYDHKPFCHTEIRKHWKRKDTVGREAKPRLGRSQKRSTVSSAQDLGDKVRMKHSRVEGVVPPSSASDIQAERLRNSSVSLRRDSNGLDGAQNGISAHIITSSACLEKSVPQTRERSVSDSQPLRVDKAGRPQREKRSSTELARPAEQMDESVRGEQEKDPNRSVSLRTRSASRDTSNAEIPKGVTDSKFERLLQENARMRKEIATLRSIQTESLRRSARTAVPSEKALSAMWSSEESLPSESILSAMSSSALGTLKERIYKIERLRSRK